MGVVSPRPCTQWFDNCKTLEQHKDWWLQKLAKQRLTIPRLELVAGHMAVDSVDNVCRALDGLPVTSAYCWLDSTVVLHWIRDNGEYRQFVANRVKKIRIMRLPNGDTSQPTRILLTSRVVDLS